MLQLGGAHAVVTGASKGIGRQIARRAGGSRRTCHGRGPVGRRARRAGRARSAVTRSSSTSRIASKCAALTVADRSRGGRPRRRARSTTQPSPSWVACKTSRRTRSQAASTSIASRRSSSPARCSPGCSTRGRGRITMISSLAGVTAFPTLTTYGATKAGLVHFTAASATRTATDAGARDDRAAGRGRGHRHDGAARVGHRPSRPFPVAWPARVRCRRCRSTLVARKIVDGTAAGRRDVVVPARIRGFHLIRELPSRMNDAILVGIE